MGWQPDQWYTTYARAWANGSNTQLGLWGGPYGSANLTHMVTMEVYASNCFFEGGTDSFIEDWADTGVNRRTTNLKSGYKTNTDGSRTAFTQATYSLNANDIGPGARSYCYKDSYDAGVTSDSTGEFFYMSAGGDTPPSTSQPRTFNLSGNGWELHENFDPIQVKWLSHEVRDGKLHLSWEIDNEHAPQFSYKIRLLSAEGAPVVTEEKIVPHARTLTLELPAGLNVTDHSLELELTDIFNKIRTITRQIGAHEPFLQ